ncbi:hypothetical protein H0H81_010662 [Sphagnurus paluster]|uniref:Uncharacterized protein n=1 Tax=Sphagnurus paluster TaxID=117069 RepID=A0A9P7GLU9_9AGAR|nr:hypothetical protein H0H81_010662 [Sphagnurus paluster]
MFASQGTRTTIRNASNFVPHTAGPGTSRGIHIPSFVRLHPRVPNLSQTQKLFSHSRHIVTQFFNLLTTPGLRAPTQSAAGRSLHSATRGYSTIQQGLSLHVRKALSRPSNSHFLPRAPGVAPRGIAQVGLGTARNFSSTRPIFQNLVENVPIVGRAIVEADLELKMRQEREAFRKPLMSKSTQKQGGKEMLKPKVRDFATKAAVSDIEAELEQLRARPPTPSTRTPLPENPDSLLPLPTLASIHASHELHSLRVSSLFSRLDAGNVWERGVQCSAFSHGGGAEGVCTMLKVEFIGWTKAEVRGVIGESGTGWCVLEETAGVGAFTDSDEDDLSEISSVASDDAPAIDPSQSLFLPTLDFSSSFLRAASPPLRVTSPSMRSFSDIDPWADDSTSDSGDSWVSLPHVNDWDGFSSQFAKRVEAEERNRYLF